ncbi:hypothetical protein FHS35_004023 [Streptomyces umbrinus]|uniref:hypothetical protein n=1 Tax=Streptomyces umbrinus TaxID=67370 RepID=UPI00167CA95E|nr:hypothetical protein [Streptomyces umbrinus]MCR3727168.1 hypothetical protein [Streptomyces umbrinus]GHH54637.1 hypothetical protein GCM10018775_58150 [Streptomyces umbrinus]
MTSPGHDCTVTTLVEVQGGPAKWEKVEQHLHEVGWSYRTLVPKERRTARRALGTDPAVSRFLWVAVPVAGSPWRADREASWQVAALRKETQVVVYDRLLRLEEADRTIQPDWQLYSTRARAWATPPTHARAWAEPFWRLRRLLYRAGVGTGLFDVGLRVRGSGPAVVDLARGLTASDDVDVRPLDGRGRPGTVQHREDALNRALALILGPLFATGFFLVLARSAGPLGVALCWLAALACTGVAWWTALTLPLAHSRLRSALAMLGTTAAAVLFALGIPGLKSGMTAAQTLVFAAVAYYGAGLVLLGRRWRWQTLAAGVLPLIATVVVAALPLTSRFLHDIYADELSLTPAETSVSGVWQLAAAVKLLWPSLGAVLFIAAGWGILRYFHFIRPRSITAGVVAAVALATALTMTVSTTLTSPQAAADRLKEAAARGTEPPPYFGVSPEWVCVVNTVPPSELTEKGGALRPGKAQISFGVADGQVVLWNPATSKPLRIAADQVRLTPPQDQTPGCGPRDSGQG